MLAKNKRIPRELFKSVLESRLFFNSPNFSLRVGKGDGPRLAVSVSKKVSKKAVIRNRVRRRAYAASSTLIEQLPARYFLLIAKPGSTKVRGKELKEELAELLKKG